MAGTDFDVEIKQLRATMKTIGQVLDLDGMRAEIADLGEQVAAPDLWDDQENATRVTGRLSALQGQLDRFTELDERLDDVEIMVQLAQEENDAVVAGRGRRASSARSAQAVESLEVRTLLSGEYDEREALLTIRSGAGGVDAADFAEMLMRMYTRWAERNKYPVEVFDTSYAEEAGIKSATFAIHAPYAYGTLSVEGGTHRLVRISPVRQPGPPADVVRRGRGGAGARADRRDRDPRGGDPGRRLPLERARAARASTPPTPRSGSPTSRPASSSRCQNEKSQLQNKASAMVILKAKLLAVKKAEERAEIDALRGDANASWGDQMRSYVLNPYQMVKDLRTEYEVGNPQAVFDGDIDGFLEAGIRWRRSAEVAAS